MCVCVCFAAARALNVPGTLIPPLLKRLERVRANCNMPPCDWPPLSAPVAVHAASINDNDDDEQTASSIASDDSLRGKFVASGIKRDVPIETDGENTPRMLGMWSTEQNNAGVGKFVAVKIIDAVEGAKVSALSCDGAAYTLCVCARARS